MEYGNAAIIVTVIAVVTSVLSLAFIGLYYLNSSVDRNTR
jgi:hypothetical protein